MPRYYKMLYLRTFKHPADGVNSKSDSCSKKCTWLSLTHPRPRWWCRTMRTRVLSRAWWWDSPTRQSRSTSPGSSRRWGRARCSRGQWEAARPAGRRLPRQGGDPWRTPAHPRGKYFKIFQNITKYFKISQNISNVTCNPPVMSPRNPPKVIALVTVAKIKFLDVYFLDLNFLRDGFVVCSFLFEEKRHLPR